MARKMHNIDRLVMLLSTDWFLRHWPSIGIAASDRLARLMGNASSARLMRNVRTGHGILLLNFLHVRHGLNARQLERRKRPRKCLNCDGLSAKPAANAGALLCQSSVPGLDRFPVRATWKRSCGIKLEHQQKSPPRRLPGRAEGRASAAI